jgi:uncharacterized membrane protein YfcA
MLIGMAKNGLSGLGLIVIPLMANSFGGKDSVGILLPVLIFADILAVIYFSRHANWKHLLRLIPWAIPGILIGAFLGNFIPDKQFEIMLSIIILLGIGIMVWQDLKKEKMIIPDNWWFAAVLGLLGGFTSMVGNAAGPILTLYLLSMRLPKNSFIGTGAWFFFIVNLSKVPLHVFYWKTIDVQTTAMGVIAIPTIVVGAIATRRIVDMIPEKIYRAIVLISTFVAAIFLL